MNNTKPIYLYDLSMNLLESFATTQECADYLHKDVLYLYHNLKYCKRIRFNNKWYIIKRENIAEK